MYLIHPCSGGVACCFRAERQDLLPRHGNGREERSLLQDGEEEGRDAPAAAAAAGGRNPRRTLMRQLEVPQYSEIVNPNNKPLVAITSLPTCTHSVV